MAPQDFASYLGHLRIKPSFAWVLYRAGYGFKDDNQERILKVKLPHEAVAEILSRCSCGHGGRRAPKTLKTFKTKNSLGLGTLQNLTPARLARDSRETCVSWRRRSGRSSAVGPGSMLGPR